jgi:hypothetical protein
VAPFSAADFVLVPCGARRGEPMTDEEMYAVAEAMAGVQTSAGEN